MAATDELDDDVVARFVREKLDLIKREYSPTHLIVFGSRAKGTARPDSDVDVVVVSERFREIRHPNRMGQFLNTVRPDQIVEAICYTPEEFQEMLDKRWPFVEHVVAEGVRVV